MRTINAVTEELREKVCAALPHGCGFNSGCWVAYPCSKGARFKSEYQHLHEDGYYDGWVSVVVYLRTVQVQEFSAHQWQAEGFMEGPRPVIWDKHPGDVECRISYQWDESTRRILRRDPALRDYIGDTVQEAIGGLLTSHSGKIVAGCTFPGIKVHGFHRPPDPGEYWVKA